MRGRRARAWLASIALSCGLAGAVACVIQPQPLPPGVTDIGGASGSPGPRDPDGAADFPTSGGGSSDAGNGASDSAPPTAPMPSDAGAGDASSDGAADAGDGGDASHDAASDAGDGGNASHDAATDGG